MTIAAFHGAIPVGNLSPHLLCVNGDYNAGFVDIRCLPHLGIVFRVIEYGLSRGDDGPGFEISMHNRQPKTFLLVEDDPNDAFLIELELKNEAPEICLHWVNDGHEAMDYLEGRPPYTNRQTYPLPDVIVLDLRMPRVGGFDFLEWLHSRGPKDFKLIPVIVMSSSNLPQDVNRAYALGANSYFVKPFHFGAFRERIRMLGLMWGEYVETPRVAG